MAHGAVRVHTLSSRAVFASHDSIEIALASLEIAITAICAVFTVAEATTSPPLDWHNWPGRSVHSEEPPHRSGEDETSSIGLVFYLWLAPIMRLGHRTELEEKHIAPLSITAAATITPTHAQETLSRHDSGIRLCIVNGHAAWVVTLGILLATVQICQPLVIQALVAFLSGNQDPSVGSWLIVALSLRYAQETAPAANLHRK